VKPAHQINVARHRSSCLSWVGRRPYRREWPRCETMLWSLPAWKSRRSYRWRSVTTIHGSHATCTTHST